MPFVPAYLVALGPWVAPVLVAVVTGLIWLVLWLLEKGGVWRVAMALTIVGMILMQLAPLVW